MNQYSKNTFFTFIELKQKKIHTLQTDNIILGKYPLDQDWGLWESIAGGGGGLKTPCNLRGEWVFFGWGG